MTSGKGGNMERYVEIIGGGITGLTAALYCEKGIRYKIIEKENKIGGILRDWEIKSEWYCETANICRQRKSGLSYGQENNLIYLK